MLTHSRDSLPDSNFGCRLNRLPDCASWGTWQSMTLSAASCGKTTIWLACWTRGFWRFIFLCQACALASCSPRHWSGTFTGVSWMPCLMNPSALSQTSWITLTPLSSVSGAYPLSYQLWWWSISLRCCCFCAPKLHGLWQISRRDNWLAQLAVAPPLPQTKHTQTGLGSPCLISRIRGIRAAGIA